MYTHYMCTGTLTLLSSGKLSGYPNPNPNSNTQHTVKMASSRNRRYFVCNKQV